VWLGRRRANGVLGLGCQHEWIRLRSVGVQSGGISGLLCSTHTV
jgi:hypothetical protein